MSETQSQLDQKPQFAVAVAVCQSWRFIFLTELRWSRLNGRAFIATIDIRTIPDAEKMSHWKALITGKQESHISGTRYSGQFQGTAWSILERKFGRPHVIIDAQIENLQSKSSET